MSFPPRYSLSGASVATFRFDSGGRPIIGLLIPIGGGRRMRIDLTPGQARAVYEALAGALPDAEDAIPSPGHR